MGGSMIGQAQDALPASSCIDPVMLPAIDHWSKIRCGFYTSEWIARAIGVASPTSNKRLFGGMWMDIFRPVFPHDMSELFRAYGMDNIQVRLDKVSDQERLDWIKKEVAFKRRPPALLLRRSTLHWIAVGGYDDAKRVFYVYDSNKGSDSFDPELPIGNSTIGYDELLGQWRGRLFFRHVAIVITTVHSRNLKKEKVEALIEAYARGDLMYRTASQAAPVQELSGRGGRPERPDAPLCEPFLYEEAFSRNIGIFSSEQQRTLRKSMVAIAGLGGVGGIYAATFARLGIGRFRISDPDVFELANMNRQAGANMGTLGRPKAEAVRDMILSINPEASVEIFPGGLTEENARAFFSGADVALDGIDFFSIDARRLFFRAAQEAGVFALTAGPVGYGSSMLVFDPSGMSFDEYFDLHDGQGEIAMLTRFGIGLTPTLLQRHYFDPDAVDWKSYRAPSLVIGTLLCANMISCEAVKLLLGGRIRTAPRSVHFDPYVGKLKRVWVPFGNRNPWQRLKRVVMEAMLRSNGSL